MSTPAKAQKSSGKTSAGKGIFGWLGRQVGHVSKALKHPVEQPKAQAEAQVDAPAGSKTIYHDRKVVQHPMPGRPGVVLRRTVIDEALVSRNHPKSHHGEHGGHGEQQHQ